MTFGERVSLLRKKKKLSQQELARLVGYESRQAISYIEKGDRDIPLDKVILLSNILGCTPSYLIGWEDEYGRDYSRMERLYNAIGSEDLTEEEENMIVDYAKYLISKRK